MVNLIGGYPIAYDDVKNWALRHWPDMDIYDDDKIANIIESYHMDRGCIIQCPPVEINEEAMLFFVVYTINDPLSTRRMFKQIPETEAALRYKSELFSHEEDKELAEKSQFTTLAIPFIHSYFGGY